MNDFDPCPDGYVVANRQDVAYDLYKSGNKHIGVSRITINGIEVRKFYWPKWMTVSVDTWLNGYQEIIPLSDFLAE